MWTIFLPKIWGNTVEKIHPLPSRQNFKSIMKEDRSKGIDGHNPRDKRREDLKEKILAAKRANIKEIILCNQNKADVEEIKKEYVRGLKFHYVSKMSEVIDIAITNYNVDNFKTL